MVLSYYEAPEEEIPDESIWHHQERLEEWFVAVKQRRESGMQPVDEGEETSMATNELSREMENA